jgi:Bacterial protein of unknown function (DUF945)
MKKILAALVGILLVYIGICFSLGFVAENFVKEQLVFQQKHSAKMNGFKIEMTEFSRGIFGSHADVTIRFAGSEPALDNIVLTSHSKIQHGPLLFLNGFSMGAYAYQSTLVLNTGDEETDKKIKELLGDSLGLISANVGFDKSYSGDWTVEAINATEESNQVKIDKSVITFSGDFKNSLTPNLKAEFAIGAVSVKDETTEVTMDPWAGKLDQRYIDAGVPLANMNLGTKKISINSSAGLSATLENLTMEQKQQLNDKNMNTLVVIRLDKFSGPLEVKNSFYQVEFNNVPVSALKNLYEAMGGDSDPQEQLAKLMPALTGLLADGVELKLGMGSEFMEGKLKGDFNLLYHSNAEGKNLMDLQTPEEMLALFAANLDFSVSESIVSQTPMAAQMEPLVGTYVTKENGTYNLKANLKDTQLVIGTQTIPAEQYMPLLMMGAMGMAASQHQETPSEESIPADGAAALEEMDAEMETEAEVTE